MLATSQQQRDAGGAQVEALVVEVDSKTAALEVEQLAVQQLRKLGIVRVRNVAHNAGRAR